MEETVGLSKTEFLTCRKILSTMVITCFMVNYMIRVNMSIAIVEMIESNSSNTSSHGPTFQWNEHQKNDILGCFFWGYLVSAIPGGRYSEIYGTKIVLGTAMLIASLLTIITPFACYAHYYWVLLVRIALGVTLGVSWPSIPPLAVKWVAPEDTAKFMAHTIACAIGAALTLPLCGYIIAYLGWPSAFYITGVISLIWSVSWFYFVYDSPKQHPRISKEEKATIENETSSYSSFLEKKKTPWTKILSSGPVWAIIVADICLQFNTNVILNDLSSYLDQVLHFNIKENGLLSSLPFFATYAMAIASAYVGDKWRKSGTFTTITIRKLFTSICFCFPALLFLIQVFWGYSRTVSVVVFTVTQGFLAFSTAGFMSNSMDISPVYSGTIFGLAFASGGSTGYVSSKIIAFVTSEQVTFEEWRYIFSLLIVIDVIGCVFYNVFASADIQKWNPRQRTDVEMKKLTSNGVNVNEL